MDTKIFDTLLEPTFVLSSEKKVLYCNEPAALMADVSVRKLMRSQPIFDTLFRFDVDLEGLQNLAGVTDATPYQETRFATESGREGKVQVTIQPFETQDGQTRSWLVYFRDVTLEETLQKKYRAELEQKEGYIKELEDARAKLEDYSKNLEKKVAERTAELSRLNQLMTALLDSLGQGFCIFDPAGTVLEIASKACLNTLEKDPRGQKIWEVLGLTAKQVPGFQKWTTTLFAEMLPFEDLAPLGPPRYPHTEGREIEVQYYPLRAEGGAMEGVVVVATDITSLVQAQREAATEKAHARMILQLIKNKRQVASFIRESEQMLSELRQEFAKPRPDPEAAFRLLHTLKGGAAIFSIKEFAETCHHAESLLGEWKSLGDAKSFAPLAETCGRLPGLFRDFLESNRAILGSLDRLSERWVEIPASKVAHFAKEHWPQGPRELRESFFTSFLFEPVGPLFEPYDELIQSLGERLGKDAGLHITNPEFRLLPEPYENLFGTLIHAFRNALDHGIETPDVRQERGKDTKGRLTLSFQKRENSFVLTLEDDGGGIDPQRIRQKLEKQGSALPAESDEQVIQHIFDAQFSTREEVTDLSGRGVGMDAIAQAARALGGKVWVESKLGHGTKLCVQVPWIQEPAQLLQKAA